MQENPSKIESVVVLFDTELTKEFVELSRRIHQVIPSKVVLNTEDALPHLTLQEALYPVRNLTLVEYRLEEMLEGIAPFTLVFSSKEAVAGTIFINAVESKELYRVHNRLVEGLKELREGLYDPEELRLPGTTDKMKNNLTEYGMLLAKEDYKPHITIARPYDPAQVDDALSYLPQRIVYSALANQVHLVEIGNNGVCKRIVKSIDLK